MRQVVFVVVVATALAMESASPPCGGKHGVLYTWKFLFKAAVEI